MWIYVPTNTHSSEGESHLYIFEDTEAVIKMIIKGRSPTMRHVSRTNRVALDWLFDRINLEQKIQIKYVDTKNQLADMLTKGVSRVTSGTIFFVCSPWWVSRCSFAAISSIFFLIRSESRAPCQREVKKRLPVKVHRCQKPKRMVPAKTRPVSLVLRSPWSARENPPQDLGYPVDPVNADEGQGSQTRARKLVRTTQSPEVGKSQVRRQEKAQKSNPWKQDDREVSTYSTGTRKLVRTATPRTEFQNMKYTNHQDMTKILQFFQKKMRITVRYSTHSMEASKTNMLIWCESSCLRQWKQPFILDQIIWRVWKSTRTRTSWKFRACSISQRNGYWSILKRFWMWIWLTAPRKMERSSGGI